MFLIVQEFNALKRRCRGKFGERCTCIVTVCCFMKILHLACCLCYLFQLFKCMRLCVFACVFLVYHNKVLYTMLFEAIGKEGSGECEAYHTEERCWNPGFEHAILAARRNLSRGKMSSVWCT